MKKPLIIGLTILVIAAVNWVLTLFLDFTFLEISIPVGGLAIVLIYFVTSKGGMASRQMDMSIQGQTGIRMDQQTATSETSYVLIGAILYAAIMLVITFVTYREYFIGVGI